MELQKEIKDLHQKEMKTLESKINEASDDFNNTYDEYLREIKNDIIAKKARLEEIQSGLADVEGCLRYCRVFLSNLTCLWDDAQLDVKQRIQTLIFPEEIYFDGKSIRTEKMALIFQCFRNSSVKKSYSRDPNESKLGPNTVRNVEYLQIQRLSTTYLDYLFFS